MKPFCWLNKTFVATIATGLFFILFTSTSNAALSATTANTIEGTPPYLTFDGGVTKATNTDELLMIKLSDGTVYKASDAAGTVTMPIVLPTGDTSFADIETLIPQPNNAMALTTLVTAPYNYAMDDDGDGNFSATGNLSISIKDVNGTTVGRTAMLDACNAPYKVTLASTAGTLTTQFGAPNSSTFNASTATYHIKDNGTTPYTCFAKPNLNNTAAAYIGPATQWNTTKGFIPQIENGLGTINFPTTGFNGAFFDITLANTTAAQVITDSNTNASSGASNVTLNLSVVSANVLRVSLKGPSSGQKLGGLGKVAVTGLPATFKLKSGTTDIYSFTIYRWFIPKSGTHGYDGTGYPGGQTVPAYCGTIPGFRVPSRSDYTNSPFANAAAYPPNTSAAWGGNYTRTISGGIFAEWGFTANTYYTNSDWEAKGYWSREPWNATNQYYIFSLDGRVTYVPSSLNPPIINVVCVSP